jgi:hypothetical protein
MAPDTAFLPRYERWAQLIFGSRNATPAALKEMFAAYEVAKRSLRRQRLDGLSRLEAGAMGKARQVNVRTPAERFRQHAADCAAMCVGIPAPLRPALMELAEAWSELASESQRHDDLTSTSSKEQPQ